MAWSKGAGAGKFFLDFARIFDKSKHLRVRLHPRLLHHWFEDKIIASVRYCEIYPKVR